MYLWSSLILYSLSVINSRIQRVASSGLQRILAKGLLIVECLMNEYFHYRPYYLTGTQLTEAIVDNSFDRGGIAKLFYSNIALNPFHHRKHKAQNILLNCGYFTISTLRLFTHDPA